MMKEITAAGTNSTTRGGPGTMNGGSHALFPRQPTPQVTDPVLATAEVASSGG